jgi:O-glycosyl hydrolase
MQRLTVVRRLIAVFAAFAAFAAAFVPVFDPAVPAAAAEAGDGAEAAVVTVRPDPSYQGSPFEGWGTSLAWFANATGGYPDAIRDRLADLLFGDDGLNLNIARYNIGGGNAPDVPDYLRPGGAVPGWWRAPAGTTRADTDWWDPADPADWNLAADPAQRWWVDRIKHDVTRWETFSNSPPWFQTVSGYVSGGFDAKSDQIRADAVDDFAAYLVGVTRQLERAHGIKVDTIDPVNEPNTSYWSTKLGADGNPIAGRQEGAHVSPALQGQIIQALDARLRATHSRTEISAMDETNPGTFAADWNAYAPDVREQVGQLNVHTYGTSQRTTVRDIAKGAGKPLWMSEVEGSWLTGQDFTSMVPGLGLAQQMVDDLRELEPSAWVFWQPVEDYDNMKPGGESAVGANWGSIQVPFTCTAADTLQTCPIYTNSKFNTARNFTHYIRPGDRLIKTGDPASVAALTGGRTATVVHINATAEPRTVRIDLSGFRTVTRNATVTPIVTSASGALVPGRRVAVRDGGAQIEVPAQSVTSFLVDGVWGVAPIRDDRLVRLTGVQSGKSLTDAGTGAVIRTDSPADAAQLWRIHRLSHGYGERARFTVSTAAGDRWFVAGGQTLVAGGQTLSLAPTSAKAPPEAQWMLSTTGDGTYTFVNVSTGRLLEVGGQATGDDAVVDLWLANSGDNQRWRLTDEPAAAR